MKKVLILLLFILPSIIIHAQSTGAKIRGVVMGISKYMNVPSLQYADRDALSFYEFLLSPAGGRADTNKIRLLLNEKATSYNFFEAMDNLLDAAKEGEIVYIYFAGHGDIEKKTERQNGFLIGYNAPANCYAAGGSIGVRYLQDYVETLVSKNKSKVLLIIDACRSGKLAGGREGAEITALALKQEWKGVTKILSCQPGEKSMEGDQWGGGAGVFTYFMLRGLKGLADKDNDEKVTLKEIYNYLDEIVTKETDNKQMPEVVGDKRQDIAKVDKETYLALLNKPERKTIIPENLLSAGFEADLSKIDDFSVLKAYERFKEYIKTENLIAYNDEDEKKETALSIYRSLEGNREANPIITSMKRELLASLQNRAQISLNKYMNSEISIIVIDNPIDSITRDLTYQELKTALSITDSTYSLYNQIKFRYLLWSHILEKDTDKKLKILDECLKIGPDEPIIYNAIGIIKDNIEKYDEAINYYKRATELAPNWSTAWRNIGTTLCKLGKYEEGLRFCIKALELKPDNGMAWSSKGYALLGLGKTEESIKDFDKAIELKPNNEWVWYGKGYALLGLGKNDESIKYFDKAIKIKPDFELAWNYKVNALVNLRKYDEAIKCYDKVIELKPDNVFAWCGKAFCYSLLKNKEEMLKSLKRAIELNPKVKEDIKKDEDLKEYWDDPDFKKLVE